MRWLTIALVVAGCYSSPIEIPRTMCSGEGAMRVEATYVQNKVDVLFVVDDSPGMAPKQAALQAALPKLLARLDAVAAKGAPASYHFGVISADLGAGPNTLDAQHCRPGGDNGALRVPAACAVPSGGVRYVDYNQLQPTSNVPDVVAALGCMTSLGEAGCGFPAPLEAAYRALHDPIPDNQGFLRSDALLVVVYVTEHDDCSAPPTTDLFEAATDRYGVLDRFRCTQFGIMCNGQPVPPMSLSGLSGCQSLPSTMGGKLIDVDKYLGFFTKPAAQGGVKVDPSNVVLVSIAGPPDPVGVTVTSPCADASATSCAVLNPSCVSPTDPTLSGDPAVRLDAVVRSAKHEQRASICDGDDSTIFDQLGDNIETQIASGCFDRPVALRSDGAPDCVATDVTEKPDGSTGLTTVPACADNGHVTPCWQLVDSAMCTPVTNPIDGTEQQFRVQIDRGTPAVATTTYIACTIPCG